MDSPGSAPRDPGFRSFAEFYPFYLAEHRHPVSRGLHYIGTWGAVVCMVALAVSGRPWWLLGALLSGYSFAWVGHFAFERNRPATFQHPLYSLAGDFRMWWDLNLGRLKFRDHSTLQR
jgi:hypothetical protein